MKKNILIIWMAFLALSVHAQKSLKLENENLIAEFNPSDGSIVHFKSKATNWDIQNREKLGQSFEMLIPLPERRLHYVRGIDQTAPEIKTYKDSIVFIWKSLKSKLTNQSFDITFRGVVAIRNNGLIYSGQIMNNSGNTIEYMAWPYLGEVSVPDKSKNLVCQSRNVTRDLFPTFLGDYGYWGVEYPTNANLLPEESFLLIRNEEQGLYVSSQQMDISEMIISSFELIPGYEIYNRNPVGDDMDGQPVRIQFKANHIVYALPHSAVELSPIALIPYKGSWHAGAGLYKEWIKSRVQTATSPDWIKQPLNWQKITISNGQELIDYAREAKKYGVSALNVTGWKRNGKNNHIETIENLSSAIQECKKMGIYVILGINFTSVDFRSDWYKNELGNDVIKDPFDITYDRSMICPLKSDVQKMAQQEYAENPAILMANGTICDDNNHRGKTYFCFDPDHGHKVPEWVDKGTMQIDREYTVQAKKFNKDFVALGSGLYDQQNSFYDGYMIQSSIAGSSMQRYLNPLTPIISTMDVRTARKEMNLCLKNRYNICYDLRFYSNQLSSYPHVMEYGKRIETLRKKYRDFIWDGEFCDVLGASVTGKNITYAVYTRKSDGKKAVIIINQNENEPSSVQVSINDSAKTLVYASPENPETATYNGNIILQPQSAVVVIEK